MTSRLLVLGLFVLFGVRCTQENKPSEESVKTMQSPVTPQAPTVGVIARRLGEPLHRVEYVLRTRNIHPVARAGNARVYSEADIAYIASELRRIDEDREFGR